MSKLTEEKISVFLANQGEQCPLCCSKQISTEVPDSFSAGILSQAATCNTCNAEWVTEYHIANVQVAETATNPNPLGYIFTQTQHYFAVHVDLDYTKFKSSESLPSLDLLYQRVCECCGLALDEVEGTVFAIKKDQGQLVMVDDRGVQTAIYTDNIEQWIEDFQL